MTKLAKHLRKIAEEVEKGKDVELEACDNELRQARMASMLHEWANEVESKED